VIRSFKDAYAKVIFERRNRGKGIPADLVKAARRKLIMLDSAQVLNDLRAVPSNHLEALKGVRAGPHSIRINDQYRLCFVWTGSDAETVEITDYH